MKIPSKLRKRGRGQSYWPPKNIFFQSWGACSFLQIILLRGKLHTKKQNLRRKLKVYIQGAFQPKMKNTYFERKCDFFKYPLGGQKKCSFSSSNFKTEICVLFCHAQFFAFFTTLLKIKEYDTPYYYSHLKIICFLHTYLVHYFLLSQDDSSWHCHQHSHWIYWIFGNMFAGFF